MKRAIFPISVDNPRLFSSDNTMEALRGGLQTYDEISFLVADRLQIYNDITKANGDLDIISSLDWTGGYRKDRKERTVWLRRLRERLQDWPSSQNWKVVSISDAMDGLGYLALRSVWLLYRLDHSFRDDVNRVADDFAERSSLTKQDKIMHQMSVGYLLEEVAVNVRLRVVRGIEDEYYMGPWIGVLPKLYAGHYRKRPEELLGRPISKRDYRFFRWTGSEWVRWSDQELGTAKLRLVR
jgi:hypothetical protein